MVFTLKDANADFKSRSGDIFDNLIQEKLSRPTSTKCENDRLDEKLSIPTSAIINCNVKSHKSTSMPTNDDTKFKVPAPLARSSADPYIAKRRNDRSPAPRCPYKNYTKYSLACVDSDNLYTGLRGDSLNNKVASDFLATLRARKAEEKSMSARDTGSAKQSRTSNGKITLAEYDFSSSKAGSKSKSKLISDASSDEDAVSAKMSKTQVSLSHLQSDSEDDDICM